MSTLALELRSQTAVAALVVAGLLALALSAIAVPVAPVGIAAILAAALVAGRDVLFRWNTLVGLLILVILFIPIRRYTLPGNLPIQLEPYRLVVGLVVALWLSSLLVDRRVRLVRTGLEAPLLLVTVAAVASILANSHRIATLDVEPEVLKTFSFLVSFLLVFFFVASVVRTFDGVDRLVRLLAGGGAVIAVLAVYESRTGYNPFDHLSGVVPFLETTFLPNVQDRGARFRAYGPAEHAIALGAVLAMLLPLSAYLALTTRKARWWVATALIAMGVFATVSRTGILMLAVAGIVFAWLRPGARKLWPLLLPLAAMVHFAMPGTLGTIKYSFFPEGGLIAEQRGYEDSGRIGDLGPSFAEAAQKPLLGQGLGTRIPVYNLRTGKAPNARILDDQWLVTLLETGVVGALGWAWFFLRLIRRLGRSGKDDFSRRGWLLVALAASLTAYAIGMFTYDAFSFVQVTFIMYILAGFGVTLLRLPDESAAPVAVPPA